MFNMSEFGKRVKMFRTGNGFSQKETAFMIGVSEQAVSKWENGECLPDVYNLKLLAQVLRVSADSLLDTGMECTEKVIETVMMGSARFEIVEKPETVLAGKIIYAKDFPDESSFNAAIDSVTSEEKQAALSAVSEPSLPMYDITVSVNFWKSWEQRAYGFVRQTETDKQPAADVYKMPASLFIRAYTDKEVSRLVCREHCEIWELFAYIRDYFMPAHGFVMAENGAQEMEVFDTADHRSGYAYMPVSRI